MTKIIALQAFGGLLKADPIVVADYPPVYEVHCRRVEKFNPMFDPSTDELPIEPLLVARFVPTEQFVVLANKNTAMIYELESLE